jgi:hypothetical protein
MIVIAQIRMAADSRQCVVTLPAHDLCQPPPAQRRIPRAAAFDNRSILLLEVSVWEPIGRVRLAPASVNSVCGDTNLSRNAHGDARWLANWHPDGG